MCECGDGWLLEPALVERQQISWCRTNIHDMLSEDIWVWIKERKPKISMGFSRKLHSSQGDQGPLQERAESWRRQTHLWTEALQHTSMQSSGSSCKGLQEGRRASQRVHFIKWGARGPKATYKEDQILQLPHRRPRTVASKCPSRAVFCELWSLWSCTLPPVILSPSLPCLLYDDFFCSNMTLHDNCKEDRNWYAFFQNAGVDHVPDKNLIQEEKKNFFALIEPGDVILADLGFAIAEETAIHGSRLEIPTFTHGKGKLSQDMLSSRNSFQKSEFMWNV